MSPRFALSVQNARALAQICQRLDGIPLAIELAAARVAVLSVDQIAARLDQRFRLLTGGSRTALRRQQTLQAAIDWSYDLLSEDERTVLQRLSVFVGGCSLEAAEAVGGGDGIEPNTVLDLLGHLVDKSLVVAQLPDARGEVRYRLLETLREYALERLIAESGLGSAARRHAPSPLRLRRQRHPTRATRRAMTTSASSSASCSPTTGAIPSARAPVCSTCSARC